MKVELGIGKDASAVKEALVLPAGGSLDDYAQIARRYLDCHAVVIRLVDPAPAAKTAAAPGSGQSSVRICAAFNADEADAAASAPAKPADPAELADPVAANRMGFGFYAGLPLRPASGVNLGMLAAVDYAPRELSPEELATLKQLARIIVQTIEAGLASSGQQTGRTAKS